MHVCINTLHTFKELEAEKPELSSRKEHAAAENGQDDRPMTTPSAPVLTVTLSSPKSNEFHENGIKSAAGIKNILGAYMLTILNF